MKQYCEKCTPKNYHPIKFDLGKCQNCGTYTGVAECEHKKYDMPEGFQSIFGDLNNKPKK